MNQKRKVAFTTDTELDQSIKKHRQSTNESGNTRLHSGKYTLDSDEEDEKEYDDGKAMNQDDLDGKLKQNNSYFKNNKEENNMNILVLEIGQERATISFDDDVKITPFNIDEEMEEGYYDESGCFQWKKRDV